MRVVVYLEQGSSRSQVIAEAMEEGARHCGEETTTRTRFDGVEGDCAVFYGWRNPAIAAEYQKRKLPFVHVDLGWWERKPEGLPFGGYHKVAVNSRDPDHYMARQSPPDRFQVFGLKVLPWRRAGDAILLAGMSAKSAKTEGYEALEWERWTLLHLRRVTQRPIIYRPKPSWRDARPIAGIDFSPASEPLAQVLGRTWAVVTLRSNVAIDALLAGVPVYASRGVSRLLSMPQLSNIEFPPLPEGREQLMADIGYCQWSVAEMKSGACWAHLKEATPLCA